MILGSLSNRVTLLLLVTGLAVMGAGALLMDWRMDDELESKYQQTLLAQARTLAALVELEQDTPDSYSRASQLAGEIPALYELRCPGMPPLRSDPAPVEVPPGWPAGARPEPRFDVLEAHDAPLGSVMFTFDMSVGVARDRANGSGRRAAMPMRTCALLYQQDRRPFEQILVTLDWILALGPTLAACIALVAVPWIVRRGLRPVRTLVDRMSRSAPMRRADGWSAADCANWIRWWTASTRCLPAWTRAWPASASSPAAWPTRRGPGWPSCEP